MNREKMTKDEAIAIIRKEYLCVDRDCDIERNCGKCDLMMPSKEPILEAYKMAIKALEQMPVTTTAGEGGVIYYPQVEGVTPTVVNPTKTGHWVGVDGDPSHLKDGMTTESVWCSECVKWLTASDEYSCFGKYCPNCGAKMF